MSKVVKDFKKRMRIEGRSFKWFHEKYVRDISYVYFIIQINDDDRLSDSVKSSIENFLKD